MRTCANKVVACVRLSTLLPNIRSQDARQFISAQQIDQLEGLAVAIPWGFESPLPHHLFRQYLQGSFATLRLTEGREPDDTETVYRKFHRKFSGAL